MIETRRMKVCGGLSAALIAAVLALGAPAAMAQLPGGSAADEYTENVPGAGGDQPSGHNDSQPDASPTGDGSQSSAPTGTGSTAASGPSTPSGPNLTEGAGGPTGDGSASGTIAGGSSARDSVNGVANVPATLTSQPVPAAAPANGGGSDISAAWPIALAVVLLASVGIYWYRRRYPETLIEGRRRGTPQRLTI